MAQPPYGGGVPEVAPLSRPPDDYQHIETNPQQFGAGIGQAMQQAGAGAVKAGQFFGEVAADNASNDYQDRINKILHGDPNKVGPDGKQDLGYLGLKGRAALDARPAVQKQLDDTLNEIRGTLLTPEQQLRFDNFSRRYKSYAVGQIGTHADSQGTAWYGAVNNDSAKLALEHIAVNADNPNEVAAGASDLINARAKQAELAGAQKGDPVWNETVQGAKRDALEAQLNAVAVKDPSRAMRMLDKNRDLAGTRYDEMATKFRARADKQDGDEVGTRALRETYGPVPATSNVVPVLDNIGAKYGVPGSYLLRTWQLESAGKFNPEKSVTGAEGPMQFTHTTATQYGVNPQDWQSSMDGAARLAADNRAAMARSLGRPPTDAELYLAHQQGAGGADALLENPNSPAADVLAPYYKGGRQEAALRIVQNGGNPEAPASAFTSMWTSKFNGAGAAMSSARKAAAYQRVASDPTISENVRDHAIARINRDVAMTIQAEEQTAQARKLASDSAANDIVTRIQSNQPVSINDIANNPQLDWHARLELQQIIEHRSGNDIGAATNAYGPGFWDAYKAVSAKADDPSRIAEYGQLLTLAGPNSDPNKRLTLAGVQKLGEVMRSNQKDVNTQSVNTAKLGLMNYAKGKLSFEQDTGPVKIRDPKGEAIFNGEFIPKFEAAYDAWTKGGNDPWKFLTKENIDKLVTGMRSQSQMQVDRMSALGEATPNDKNAPIPAAPEGVDTTAWSTIMGKRPYTENGTQFAPAAWATAVNWLIEHPDEKGLKTWSESKFGKAGFDGAEILRSLKPAAKSAPETRPAQEGGTGFRPGSILDNLASGHQPPPKIEPPIAPNVRRKQLEAEEADEGAATVNEAP